MSELKLDAQHRTLVGRKVGKLRGAGLVPVVVYGRVERPVNLQVNAKSLDRVLHSGAMSQILQVEVEGGESHNVLVRDVQRHPLNHSLLHADFYAVSMTETQVTHVPIHALGTPRNIDIDALVIQAMDVIEIEALPANIPSLIEVDVSKLTFDQVISVADLPVLEGVTYTAHLEEVVFSLVRTRAALEEEAEELELKDGSAEPEIISRGKADEDDEK